MVFVWLVFWIIFWDFKGLDVFVGIGIDGENFFDNRLVVVCCIVE